MKQYSAVSKTVKLGKNVVISKFVNLYGCSIGDNTKIGAFVEVQEGASVGINCKISSHTFVCDGVTIGDNCFIGHGVMFINDNHPKSANPDGSLQKKEDWQPRFVKTSIGNNVAIGSNATILGGINIGDGALIGAGSVVTKNIAAGQVWAGNPARPVRKTKKR